MTYNITRTYRQHSVLAGSEILEVFEGSFEEAVTRMVQLYAKYNDSEFYPNEDLTEIKDETGRIIWNKTGIEWSDSVISTPDFFFSVTEVNE